MVRNPSAHGGGGAKVFRGPTPVSGAQDRGSNAGARKVVGWRRQQEELSPKVLLKAIMKVVEQRFGPEMYDALVRYIRTRCEEDNCERTFNYVCAYCGVRLCELHAIDCYGVTYCRLHADPECRLADVFLVRRW